MKIRNPEKNRLPDNIRAREQDGFVAVATQGNGIYSTNNDPSLSVDEPTDNRSGTLTNYPNPFSRNTTIFYRLQRPGDVTISLLNSCGQLVKDIHEGEKSMGSHSLFLTMDALKPGIYLIRLSVNDQIEFHKIIYTG